MSILVELIHLVAASEVAFGPVHAKGLGLIVLVVIIFRSRWHCQKEIVTVR